jgi:hypothetical protein
MKFNKLCAVIFMLLSVVLGQIVAEAANGGANELRLQLSSASMQSDYIAEQEAPTEAILDYRVQVLGQRKITGPPPRQRRPELSKHHLVIKGLDTEGEEIARSIIIDPRIVRAEHADPSGKITSSKIFLRTNVEFTVVLPDDPRITSIRVYNPSWTGETWKLVLIDEVQLP